MPAKPLADGDTLGIADVREVMDSIQIAGKFGQLGMAANTRLCPLQALPIYMNGPGGRLLVEQPFLGMTNSVGQYPPNVGEAWQNVGCFEIIPQLNNYSLTMTVRLQGETFALHNNTNDVTGQGGRACYFEVWLKGWENGNLLGVQKIGRWYYDRQYYEAKVPAPLFSEPGDVNNWMALQPEGRVKQITVVGQIDPSLYYSQNHANAATLHFILKYPLHPMQERPWSATEIADGTTTRVYPELDNIAGFDVTCDGLLDLQFYTHQPI
jgi:hypothetical protein